MAADAVGAEDAKWLGDSSDSEGHVDDPERKHAESGSRCSSPCGTGLLAGQDDDASPQPSQERVCINLPVSGRVLEQALMYFAACDQHTGVLVAEPGSPGATLTSNITREDAVEMVAFADYVDSQRLLEFSAKMLGLHITTWAELRTAGLAAHVEAAVLANASDAVLCEATTSASGEFAADLRKAWLARFRNHVLLHRVLRQRMDLDTYMEHGMFGPKSGRDLTLLPDNLQAWYEMVNPTPRFVDNVDSDGRVRSVDRIDDWEPCDDAMQRCLGPYYSMLHRVFAFFQRFPLPPTEQQSAELQRELTEWLAAATLASAPPVAASAPRLHRGGVAAGRGGGSGGAATPQEHTATPESALGAPTADEEGKARRGVEDAAPRHDARAAGRRIASEAPHARDAARPTHGAAHHVLRADRPSLSPSAARKRWASEPRRSPLRAMRVGAVRSTFSVGPMQVTSFRAPPALPGRSPEVEAPLTRKPSRVGGGFAVKVSKPSRLPSSWRSGRKLNLLGKKGPRVANKRRAVPKASRQQLEAAATIQRVVRGTSIRRTVAQKLREDIVATGELPVSLAVLQLFASPTLVNRFVPRLAWCTGVAVLDLRGCRALDPACVPVIATLRRLRYLDLSGCTDCGDDEMVSLAQLEHLVTLQVCCWSKLTSAGIIGYAERVKTTRMCPAVPPMALAHRASHGVSQRLAMGQAAMPASSLRNLNLAECREIDDDCLNHIGSHLPGIEDLCVYACLKLSDRGLVGLGSLESRLQRFCWAGAYKVTSSGSRFLLGQNPNLLTYNNPNTFRHQLEVIRRGEL